MRTELIKHMLEELDIYSRTYEHPNYGLPVENSLEMNEMIKIVKKYEWKDGDSRIQDEYFADHYR